MRKDLIVCIQMKKTQVFHKCERFELVAKKDWFTCVLIAKEESGDDEHVNFCDCMHSDENHLRFSMMI